MLSELSTEVQQFIEKSHHFIMPMIKIIAALWLFNYINWKTGSKLSRWGIIPRRARGLVGIILSPLLHSNYNHLFFNSIALFFLGIFAMSLNMFLFYWATLIIIVLGGFALWCVGRYGNHIGASALISGYFGYILCFAYQQPTFITLFCAAIALYYFGGIIFSLFPGEADTSWEGHLCGFLAGIVAMLICYYASDTLLGITEFFYMLYDKTIALFSS